MNESPPHPIERASRIEGALPPTPLTPRETLSWLAGALRPWRSRILILGLVLLLGSLLPLIGPRLMGQIFDRAVLSTADAAVRYRWLGFGILGLVAIEVLVLLLELGKENASFLVRESVIQQLQQDLYEHVQGFSGELLDRYPPGLLYLRIGDNARQISYLLQEGVGTFLLAPLTASAIFGLLFWSHPRLALLALAPLPLILLLAWVHSRRIRPATIRTRVLHDRWLLQLQENLSALGLIQLLGRGPDAAERMREAAAKADAARRASQFATNRFYALLGCLVGMATILIVAAGGRGAVDGEFTGGDIVAFIGYVAYLYGPVSQMLRGHLVLQHLGVVLAGIRDLQERAPSVRDPERPADPARVRGGLEAEGISFAYGPRSVFEDFSFAVRPGEKIGIAGPSGCGKSTLAKLLVRLYDPRSGAIRLDGVDLRKYSLASLRASVVLVPQDSFLFSDTVAANLRLGRPDAEDGDLREALGRAGLEAWADALPEGLATPVGHRGLSVSAGERQRLCLARVFLRRPPVLILDEATSALDLETEQGILDRLLAGMEDRTLLVLSHRPQTLERMDRIVRLSGGTGVATTSPVSCQAP